MSFSELLKQCRKKQGVSQAELASKLGVTQQAVGKWESGKSSPDPSTVARIAELLNTTADYLLGLYRPVSNVSAPEERFFGSYSESLIPVIGTVKAGYGALAFEEDYGQEYARVKDPSNYFYLVVRGDSMEPRIQDGDLALVHKQDTLENGDLGVLIYGDEGEGTLKRYIQRGNCVVLQPFNPAYSETRGNSFRHCLRQCHCSPFCHLRDIFPRPGEVFLIEGGFGKTGNFPVLPKAPPPGELARRQP